MNKKLIKTISVACGCTTICGVGIGGVVYSTYSAPAKPIYEGTPLPNDVYEIDKTTGTLNGFTKKFLDDPNQYKDCNVMKLPTGIATCGDQAFNNKIPANINILDLSNLTEDTDIKSVAFGNNENITLLVMPSKIKTVQTYAFTGLKKITKIYWDWYNFPTPSHSFAVDPAMFRYIADDVENKGTAYSLSQKGTNDEFKAFLDKFISDGVVNFSKWDVEQYQ